MNPHDQAPSPTQSNGKLTEAVSFQRWQWPAWIVTVLGLVLAVVGLLLDERQFWQSYLLAYAFWLELSLGCLGILMLHHLVGGRWSALIRRLMETGASTLPLLALLFAPLLFGLGTIYPWADPTHLSESELLQQKSAWLNVPFFWGRAALYFVVWLTLAYLLRRWSLEQDRTGDLQLAGRMRRLSAVGMILYVLTTTFAAYDWLMSLEPEWFSSIYGLLFMAGGGLAGFALAIIGLKVIAKAYGSAHNWVQSFNDLGNFLLSLVMLWAYFSFSQFLIIWSANIPEEAIWYIHRSQGGWLNVGLFLIAVHFVLPFLLLLARGLKRSVRWLTGLALFIFAGRLVDLFWLIVPAFHADGLRWHWLDLALVVAMGGAWVSLFIQQWTEKAPLAHADPHLGQQLTSHA
jgi:hypothetical protein